MSEDLGENYARAYGGRLGFGKRPALILIDLVRGYFDRDCDLWADCDDALASAIRLRDAARAAGVPVIYTNVVYHPKALDGGRFYQKALPLRHFLKGSPWADWAPGLTPAEDELVISKQHASAFFGTSLAPTLTTWGVDTVILSGVSTSGCVRASCVDANAHGFIPIIPREAVGDRHPAPHEANLFDMNAKYGDVVSEAETLTYFAGTTA
ncbi:isochorismatase family protein [Salipiger marinus]|uniref:Maleamate amidohydrolase n=1 Tax=Salipiger marinus TaxID=555512 RepID=A0A1G8PE78_9RHOB|nr:isochorismatase family protein [Salipiger marinus]SDI90752.1 maleamate amidohydrolase [Salipiger marinus]